MLKIGITGVNGFIGSHVYNRINLLKDKYEIVKFDRSYFIEKNYKKLKNFVSNCDVIIHLAAINRHNDFDKLQEINIELVNKLIASCKESGSTPHIIFSSSTQENSNNHYGESKIIGRELFKKWSKDSGAIFTGMIIPNVYGPFGKPNHNSVISTFCYQIINGLETTIKIDNNLDLVYINYLVDEFITIIDNKINKSAYSIKPSIQLKVSKLLSIFNDFYKIYFLNKEIPELNEDYKLNLFNTFRSYINHSNYFPVKYSLNTDNRGSFVELMKSSSGGQFSFSTTKPGITRGNHYHSRKIERFSVIKGKAKIELRRIDSDEILTFNLDGDNPSYVDMPIFYTHNITNVGKETLFTCFWINEPYNENDPDTYFLKV